MSIPVVTMVLNLSANVHDLKMFHRYGLHSPGVLMQQVMSIVSGLRSETIGAIGH